MGYTVHGQFTSFAGAQLNGAAIPLSALPKQLQEFAHSKKNIRLGIRHIETLVSGPQSSGTLQSPWAAEFVAAVPEIFEDYVCLSVWNNFTVSGFSQILSTVRDRVLSFVLELQQLHPDKMGTDVDFRTLPPSEVQNLYMTEIKGIVSNSNIAVNHSKITKSSAGSTHGSSINERDFAPYIQKLRTELNELGLDLEHAQEADSDLATVESQMKSPHPKSTIITEALASIRHILESGSGHIAASHLHDIGIWIQHFGQSVSHQ